MPNSKRKSSKDVVLTDDNPYTQCTLMQRRYVEARLQGLPVMAAARAAGQSSPETACMQLERNPKIRAAIKWCVQQSGQKAEELTKNDVMTGMLDAVNAAATASELVMAWRELGKLIGAYEPERKILEVHDYTKDELKMLSDDELVKLAGSKYQDAIDGEFTELGLEANDA